MIKIVMGTYRAMLWIVILLMPFIVEAAVFTVTNVNDSGAGSLRQALLDVNAAGAGPHTINFDPSLSGQTIFLSSSLPQVTVSDVTIDGDIDDDGNGDITIDAGSGDNTRNIFRANGGGDNATFKGFILEDTGYEPFRFDGDPSGITIQDIISRHNDGDYFNNAIYFEGNAVDLTVLNFTHNNPQSGQHGIRITGTAQNILIDGFNYQNGSGGTAIAIRFVGAATNVTIRNSLLDLDLFGSNNDGDYGIYFENTASNITLENVTINEADVDGVRILDADNFTVDSCSFVNCYDGIEFQNNYARTNNIIRNSVFDNNERAGLAINVANATTEFLISGNTFSNHTTNDGHGVWLYNNGGTKDIGITNNTFFNNNTGIYNEQADDVLYAENSFYNNQVGIDNVANNGNNGYELADGDVPLLTSSVDVGGGNYDVSFTLPDFCTDCDVELYTNEASDVPYNGRTYIQTVGNLAAGSHTVTVNNGGNTTGFWTALLTDNTNGSTSEFSDAFNIIPIGPGGVVAGLRLWLRADIGTTPSTTGTLTEWEDLALSNNASQFGSVPLPSVIDGSSTLFNFNKAVEFTATDQKIGNVTSITLGTSNYDIFSLTKDGMTGTRFFNIGRDNTTLNGYNWDSPGLNTNNNITIRNTGGTLRYNNNPGGGFSTTIPSITYNKFTDVSLTKGFNGADTGGVATHASTGSPVGGYTVGSNRGTGTGGDDWGFVGTVGEFIAYNRNISATERRQVDTYLAIKYGITLDFNATINDYLTSDTSIIWSATTNAGYNNDIAGIGRDDDSALSQKQSRSVNNDAIVTIGLGGIEESNSANTNSFSADKNFLLWGNNNASKDIQDTEMPITANALYRMGRAWKVQETGSVNNLTIAFDGISESAQDIELFIDTDGDGDFSNAMVITGGSMLNGKATFNGIDLNDGDIFTIGYSSAAPGGVISGLNVWLRADMGVTGTTLVSNWEDQSPTHKSADIPTGDPALLSNTLNFNPVIEFDGNDYFYFSASPFVTSYTAAEAIAVVQDDSGTANYGHPYDFGGNNRRFHYTYGNLNVYQGSFTTDRLGFNPANNTISDGKTGVSGIVGDFLQTSDWNIYGTHSETDNWGIQFNGQFKATSATNVVSFNLAAGNEHIGAASGAVFKGKIGEVILYDQVLTDTERLRVNSYLALKYGITINQATPINYVASDGATTIWDASSNVTYKNDIAGIGRDDNSALNQKQSKSINEDAIVTIGLGEIAESNVANTNSFSADKNFLLWGNDDGDTSLQTTDMPLGASAVYRLGREWKVQETGAVSNLAITFDINPSAIDPELYIDTDGDGDFTNATVVAGTVVDGKAIFSGIDLNDGDMFTLGYFIASPGGVINSLAAWYKFNGEVTSGGEGTGVSGIKDMSGNGYDLSEGSAGSQPTYVENSLNFNPGGDFDGGNDRLNGQHINFVDESDPVTLISVSVPTSFGGERRTISIGGGYDRPGLGYQGAGGNMQIRVTEGSPVTVEHSVPLTLNTPYILLSSVTNGSNPGQALMSYNGLNNEETTVMSDGIYPLANAASEGYIALGNEPNTYSDDHVGFINEAIIYNRVLEPYEKERVYTYLALKYGITLNQDYYAKDWDGSTGTRLWDFSFNSLFNHDIAGIGREDEWALDQKQSLSVNDDALVTIGLGGIEANNVSNVNVFGTESSFLVWGNDAGTISTVNAGIPQVFAEKLTRNWLIVETGSVEEVMVRIPSTLASGFADASDLALVVADDENFSSNVQSAPMVQNGSYMEAYFNFEGTKYFTFGIISSGDYMRHGKYFQGGEEKPMKF
nr:right-handed parallel beta-helix repeat-containing protein [uncultured Allomuricauda sp.]|tara:strand:- start:1597 stop:6981 length:5385 start_codon:yes stop_codon:yes gene_type:complete